MTKLSLLAATLSVSAAACSDDMMDNMSDNVSPTTFEIHIDNIAAWTVLESGNQPAKVGGVTGPAGPGEAYEINFVAGKGHNVSFATMFGESNDWFFGPGPAGIALYDTDGNPRSGDVTAEIKLWDAGTEIDQEPSVGDATGPKQPNPTFGAVDPNNTVRELGTTIALTAGGNFTRPATDAMIKATLVSKGGQAFTLRVENVSTATTLKTSEGNKPIHLSPPVWAVHGASAPLFQVGSADRAQGLEFVAESGNGAMLTSELHQLTGWPTPISPGVWAVHQADEPLYALGLVDRGQGLEHLAEDGDNTSFTTAMAAIAGSNGISMTGSFDIPSSAQAKGPAKPGDGYVTTIMAKPGDRLSFATMFGMSNDWVFATGPDGIALFDDAGMPVSGEVSEALGIYDVGTELDEIPGIGPNTGPQQPGPNTGAADPIAQVREVTPDRYSQPASAHLRVTITAK